MRLLPLLIALNILGACQLASLHSMPKRSVVHSVADSVAWVPSVNPCDTDTRPTDISEIRIHREGGCLGYFKSAGSGVEGPEFLTGPCAEYTLTLSADGTAEYVGRANVPALGRRVGLVEAEAFAQLAQLADEINFEQWERHYPIAKRQESLWMSVTMDGEGPVSVSIVRGGQRTTIEVDPSRPFPAWLSLFQSQIDRVGETIRWQPSLKRGE